MSALISLSSKYNITSDWNSINSSDNDKNSGNNSDSNSKKDNEGDIYAEIICI